MGGRLGHFIGLDFDCGIRRSIHRGCRKSTSRPDATARDAWAAIEGQGERVTENERGGHHRTRVLLS